MTNLAGALAYITKSAYSILLVHVIILHMDANVMCKTFFHEVFL